MNQATSTRRFNAIGTLQIVIIVLVVITALIHLQRGIGMSGGGPPANTRLPSCRWISAVITTSTMITICNVPIVLARLREVA